MFPRMLGREMTMDQDPMNTFMIEIVPDINMRMSMRIEQGGRKQD